LTGGQRGPLGSEGSLKTFNTLSYDLIGIFLKAPGLNELDHRADAELLEGDFAGRVGGHGKGRHHGVDPQVEPVGLLNGVL
jgi:hypothetical protein